MKLCKVCNQELPFEAFNKNKTRRDGLQSMCRACDNERRREWYKRDGNKERVVEKVLEAKRKTREWWKEFKQELECTKCGEDHPATLDFHHEDPSEKEYGLAVMAAKGYSKQSILDEMSKCIVLCANCHRKLHYET